MKNPYTIRAEKFLHEIYPYLKGKNEINKICTAVTQFNKDKNRKVKFAFGVSRYALITSDYVIKFDRKGGRWAGDCAGEYKKYQQAVKDGFAYLFAASTKVTYNHRNFYIMPRIKGVGSGKYWENLTFEEKRYIACVTSDMHNGNFGHYHKKPVIVDYAMM
jgi:hypothetical protein